MKTTILYVLTSSEKDVYLEQCWLSIHSLRYHNPDAKVTLVVDNHTKETLSGNRSKILKLVDNLVVVKCPEHYTPMERSRYLKTTMRQHVKGAFLFLDGDTLIAGSLTDVDTLEGDVMMVPDTHVKYQNYPFYEYMNWRIKDLYATDVSSDEYYFNSGAIFVKDTELAHEFFRSWNERWQESQSKGVATDQQALFKVNHDMGNVITQLPGVYNCQIGLSLQYFYDAKVLHYFNAQMQIENETCPFFCKSFYRKLKEQGEISPEIHEMVVNCKRQFGSPSMIVSRKEMDFLQSPTGKCMMNEYMRQGKLYAFVSFLLRLRRKIM